MYTENQNFINAFIDDNGEINSNRLLDAKIDVYYTEDDEEKIFSFSSRDILQTMKINENLFSGDYFGIGSVCSNQITINILFDNLEPQKLEEAKKALKSKNKIIPYIGICTNEEAMTFEYIPMGVYFMYSATMSAHYKTCAVIAYDKMYFLGELPSEELTNKILEILGSLSISDVRKDENNQTFKILTTIGEFYDFTVNKSVLRIIGESITKSSTNIPMPTTFMVEKGLAIATGKPFPTDDCTVRQYISYLIGKGGYNALFDRNGELVLRGRFYRNGTEYDEPLESDAKNILRISSNDVFDIKKSFDPIVFSSVNIGFKIFDDSTDEKYFTADIESTKNEPGLKSQVKYLGIHLMLSTVAERLAERYENSYILKYFPNEIQWRCCPFTECGDTLLLNIDGEEIHIPVMEQEIIFAGGLKSTVKALGTSNSDTAYQQSYDEKSDSIIASSGNIAGFSINPRLLSKTFSYESGTDEEGNSITKNTTIQIGHEGGSANANYIMTLQEEDNTAYSYGLHSNGDIDCGNVILAPGCDIIYSAEQPILLYDGTTANQQLNAADSGGVAHLTNVDTGEPASILKQRSGIVLAFAQIRVGTTPNPYEVHYFFIPKNVLTLSNLTYSYVAHTTVHMATANFSSIGSKRILISEKDGASQISGEYSGSVNINIANGTNSGIKYNNADWLLYKVYGV